MQKLLHHGLCNSDFEPQCIRTYYLALFHKPCKIKRRSCMDIDALKAHTVLWLENKKEIKIFPFPFGFKAESSR